MTRRILHLRYKLVLASIVVLGLALILILIMNTYETSLFQGYDLPERMKSFIGRTAFQEVSVQENVSQKEVHHVVFAKVHKAASTTVMNILLRFGLSRNLNFMLPKKGNVISQFNFFSEEKIMPSFRNGTYDILCNHVILNKTVISKYFPSDTKYIAILRDPFDQMVSAIFYFRRYCRYIQKIPLKNPVSTYLTNPMKYEPENPLKSYTNNRMSLDLGYDPKELAHESKTRVLEFIKQLEKEYDLVLITEHFDESLVLFRRLLGWKMEDIIYLSSNVFRQKTSFRYSSEERVRLQQWAWLDIPVYNHFYKVFKRKVLEQGPKFVDEVHAFQFVRQLVVGFCSQIETKSQKKFRVNQTEWNREFEITENDCYLMQVKEITIVNVVRKNHIKLLKEHAINFLTN